MKKFLARLLWKSAPIEAGLRAINIDWSIPEPDMRWVETKLNLELPIWKAITSYAIGHTLCYRWASYLQDSINSRNIGKPKFRLDIFH